MELIWNGEGEGERKGTGKEKGTGKGNEEWDKKNEEKNTENKAKNAGEVYTGGVTSRLEKKDSRLGMQARDSKKFFENLTWLTSNEATDYLRLPSVGALRVLVCKRRVPFHKLGRSLRFKRAELDCLLEISKNGGH